MTFLEVVIQKLTLKTPSGSSCRVGDASFTVRYCSDIWEWEYQGETFWDVHDLAKAIARKNTATAQKISFLSNRTKARGRSIKTNLLMMGSSLNPWRLAAKALPERPIFRMNPSPRRLINSRSLWVS